MLLVGGNTPTFYWDKEHRQGMSPTCLFLKSDLHFELFKLVIHSIFMLSPAQ